jgi:glycosyltransferase involved in cell wall biosynthesis
VELALGDSEYNRQELETLGFRPTGVLPIAVSWDRITTAAPMRALEEVLSDGLLNFLFVGRIAPNKKIEDILLLGEHFKRYVNVDYRFLFVGKYDVVPRYHAALRAMIDQYEMPKERFLFLGALTDDELATCYRTADVYISLSEHEGFCVPLVEAMAADLPVLAYAAGAVPDTLGGAGVLFSPKDLEHAAELLGVLALDDRVREQVIAGQRRRLLDFGDNVIEHHLVELLDRAGQGW